jgi:GrpB-like predicted nucleotidyltransferase (UPF0157 family)
VTLDPDLARRLRAAGVDPTALGDPREAFMRLHDRFGLRATLLDRYAIEAATRGISVDELDDDLRARVTADVIALHEPGWEVIAGSDRSRSDPVEVVDYDPAWATVFDRWRGRLLHELGGVAVRLDHVGSTAVPGLAAKPVIDVQVSVHRIEEEAAYVPSIERAGVAFRSRDTQHRYFRPAGDLPRDVQVHVCEAGSRWERQHLLFRDYLRSRPSVRDAYGRLKRELAARHRHDRIAYNEAKTDFILDAMAHAEAWAGEMGWRVEAPA